MNTFFLDSSQLTVTSDTLMEFPDSVLTIGNFDGVHLGHQAMLNQLKTTAREQNLNAMVMVFEPQPREYFAQLKGEPQTAPARITSQAEKLSLLKQYGIDTTVIATFNQAFRSLSATEFATLLTNRLNVKALVLGDDFKFGNDRTGDSEFLRRYGLPVTNLHTITDTAVTPVASNDSYVDNRISSTRIRELLKVGNLKMANHLLGRDYCIIGDVVGGDKIGRTLNFPTANIRLNRIKPSLQGVYGVDVVVLDEKGDVVPHAFESLSINQETGITGLRPHSLFGTANIGVRPSVDKPHDWRLEVYFPQFSGDLYNRTLEVRFLHLLHPELKYDNLEALKAGIKQDVSELIAWRNNMDNDSSIVKSNGHDK